MSVIYETVGGGVFYVGLDLGQAADYTALSVVERIKKDAGDEYHVRHLQRFALKTPYPAIVAEVAKMLDTGPLRGRASLVVDGTGVGAAVVDMIRQADLSPIAVTITGGDEVAHVSGGYRVPKRDLVGVLQVLLQSGRLKMAAALPDTQTLVRELLNFQVKINTNAHDSYGAWREGTHDDLVLSVALACWYADRYGGGVGFAFISWGDDDD